MAKRALILVDLQKEWINPDSPYFVGQMTGLIERTNKLIEYCRGEKYKIIFTTHLEPDGGDEFREGTANVEIIDAVARKSTDTVIKKNKISPFYRTKLENELTLVKEIVVGGVLTNLCVRSLVEDAYDRDYDICVIKDCCRAFDPEVQEFTFDDLKNTREEIGFVNLKDFIKK